jgi:hypothetical protein
LRPACAPVDDRRLAFAERAAVAAARLPAPSASADTCSPPTTIGINGRRRTASITRFWMIHSHENIRDADEQALARHAWRSPRRQAVHHDSKSSVDGTHRFPASIEAWRSQRAREPARYASARGSTGTFAWCGTRTAATE